MLPQVIRDLPFQEFVKLRAGYLDRLDARKKAMEPPDPLAESPWETESVTTLAV